MHIIFLLLFIFCIVPFFLALSFLLRILFRIVAFFRSGVRFRNRFSSRGGSVSYEDDDFESEAMSQEKQKYRHPHEGKVFSSEDGEYVDYEEVEESSHGQN